MNHLLSVVPLSLVNADGSVCKTSKKKLDPILMSRSDTENADGTKKTQCMLLIRVVTPISEFFEDLALKPKLILPN